MEVISKWKLTAKVGRRVHLLLMIMWGMQLIIVWFIPEAWRISYLIVVSIYANFVGHWSGWSAERPTEMEDLNK